jgi:hypothetical protein
MLQATASVYCKGGEEASAYAEAYSAALSIDPNGCTVLTEARAIAQAQCGGGTASASASATTTITTLCGAAVLPPSFTPAPAPADDGVQAPVWPGWMSPLLLPWQSDAAGSSPDSVDVVIAKAKAQAQAAGGQ